MHFFFFLFCKRDNNIDQNDNKFKNTRNKIKTVKPEGQIENSARD